MTHFVRHIHLLYTIPDMKYFFQLVIVFSLFSCQNDNEKSYCENQKRLLKSNSYNTAIFDFNLEDKDQKRIYKTKLSSQYAKE